KPDRRAQSCLLTRRRTASASVCRRNRRSQFGGGLASDVRRRKAERVSRGALGDIAGRLPGCGRPSAAWPSSATAWRPTSFADSSGRCLPASPTSRRPPTPTQKQLKRHPDYNQTYTKGQSSSSVNVSVCALYSAGCWAMSPKPLRQGCVDVERSLKRFPARHGRAGANVLPGQLVETIMRVLHANSHLHYYQGYHDIVITFLLVLDSRHAYNVVEAVSKKSLATRAAKRIADLIEKQPKFRAAFSVAWVITWFGHVLDDLDANPAAVRFLFGQSSADAATVISEACRLFILHPPDTVQSPSWFDELKLFEQPGGQRKPRSRLGLLMVKAQVSLPHLLRSRGALLILLAVLVALLAVLWRLASSESHVMLENYEPFEAVTILHNLPLQIECLTYCGPTLLVGTNQLLKSHKSFSKRPIQQLEAVVPLSLLISLSDGTVSVHNLDTLKALSVLDRTRGASLFACCHQTPADPGGGSGRQSNLRLCVHVKQRLLLYHWPPGAWQFAELRQELALPAAARAVSWIGPTALCVVALKTDYFRIRVDDGEILELFPFSPATGPVMAPVERNTLALCSKDSKTMFVNEKGRWRRGQKSNDGPLMVKWSKEPLLLQYLAPFLIGICADFVEVRTVDQRTSLIQNLDIPSLRSVSQHRGVLFAASANLLPAPAAAVSPDKSSHTASRFELALRLHEIGQSDPDRADELRDIDVSLVKCHYAFNLFCQRQFAESLDLLELLSIDPANVVAMYPIAPREFRDRLSRPVPEFSGQDLLESYFALAKYLSSVRKKLLAQIAQKVPPPPPIQFYTVDKY
uniref:CNH domain-containing protein n=1 Tax=Macrostomum lignano TaxID=282301 RepID=A0A1I8FGB8_9PLAT